MGLAIVAVFCVACSALFVAVLSWYQRDKHMSMHLHDHWHDLNGNLLERDPDA